MLDTLANVKSRLGITDTSYDSFLTQQITLISDVIEDYCRRKFLEADYSQVIYKEDFKTSGRINLQHYPVSDLTSIDFDGTIVDNTLYRINEPTGIVVSPSNIFGKALVTTILYTAGYAQCPSPILAVLDALVGERYNKKVAGVDLNFGADVQRISIPGAISIDFDYSLANNERKSAYGTILGNYANVLDSWRSDRAVIGNTTLVYVEEVP